MTARWADYPEEPHRSRLDEAIDRGFEPGEDYYQPFAPGPITPAMARYNHQGSPNGCDNCGARCEVCHDRMCATWGPAPVVTCAAHPTCEDCDDGANSCRDCATIRRNQREERASDGAA